LETNLTKRSLLSILSFCAQFFGLNFPHSYPPVS